MDNPSINGWFVMDNPSINGWFVMDNPSTNGWFIMDNPSINGWFVMDNPSINGWFGDPPLLRPRRHHTKLRDGRANTKSTEARETNIQFPRLETWSCPSSCCPDVVRLGICQKKSSSAVCRLVYWKIHIFFTMPNCSNTKDEQKLASQSRIAMTASLSWSTAEWIHKKELRLGMQKPIVSTLN